MSNTTSNSASSQGPSNFLLTGKHNNKNANFK